jgi:hypothetical protein
VSSSNEAVMKFSNVSTLAVIFCLCIVGCTPDATPFPVDIPTISSTPPAGSQSTLRYALSANTENLVSDLAVIQAAAQVEQLTEPINNGDLGNRYDLVAAYGDLAEGTRSPIVHHITLILNPVIAPLDNAILINILRRSLNSQDIVTTLKMAGAEPNVLESSPTAIMRTELANAGWPDGLSLILAYAYTPGVVNVAEQLQRAGIRAHLLTLTEKEIRIAFEEGRIQAALMVWKTPEEREDWVSRFGSDNVIDLYSIPISYLAISGLKVEFTASGWPIPAK